MPPKKRKNLDMSSIPKGIGRIHLEAVYTVDFSDLPNDFQLLNGHVWYLLLLNGSSIIDTMSVLLPTFTHEPLSAPDKRSIYLLVSKLDKLYKRLRRRFTISSQFAEFKEVKSGLFWYIILTYRIKLNEFYCMCWYP